MSHSKRSIPWPKSIEDAFQEKAGFSLSDHLQYACYVGSQSHNTYVPKASPNSFDDIDIFAVVVPPAKNTVGFSPWKESEHIMIDEWDLTVHSSAKFLKLLLKGNPTALTVLWVRPEERVFCSEVFDRTVLQGRDKFSTKESVHAFLGYANEQQAKMMSHANAYQGYMGAKRKALVDQFGYDTKNAAHLVRLLIMCEEFLNTGVLQVYRTADADMIRSIKKGEWTLEQVLEFSEGLFLRARAAYGTSKLAAKPDTQFAEESLFEFYRCVWQMPTL